MAVLALNGDFDIAEEPRLTDAFMTMLDTDLVVVDLSGAGYIDSTFLACLMRFRRQREERGRIGGILLTNPNAHVARILKIAQIDRVFNVACANPESDGPRITLHGGRA